ncbi:hypothetical protein ACSBR2_039196 [Camellia fascicularis]
MAGSQQEHSDVALHGTWPSHTFLALATQIHQTTGFTITIATTPINIDHLCSTIVANHQSHDQICLVALPFNSSDHDLPPNTENTEAVPLNQLITLFQASTALEAPSYQLLADITAKEDINIRSTQSGTSPQKCLEWQDLHPQDSALYISFGSQNTISASHMTVLAEGLEDSGKPFIWGHKASYWFQPERGISQPLWMEFSYRELKPGCADHREAISS